MFGVEFGEADVRGPHVRHAAALQVDLACEEGVEDGEEEYDAGDGRQ